MEFLWIALILGVVEGLTEFLPISSTGHLILTSSLLGFDGKRAEVFQIFIQLGAVMAVLWEYRERLNRAAAEFGSRERSHNFIFNIGLAFLPSALAGVLLHEVITQLLFSPRTVAAALIAGGLLILIVEALRLRPFTTETESLSWGQAVGVGFAQCLALWPGFSRSAATIMGGMVVGLDRRSATEFSFFLAIPTLFAATFYDYFKNLHSLEPGDSLWLAVALGMSFVVACISIRWLMRYVSTHSLVLFAWYRLALGVLIFVILGRA